MLQHWNSMEPGVSGTQESEDHDGEKLAKFQNFYGAHRISHKKQQKHWKHLNLELYPIWSNFILNKSWYSAAIAYRLTNTLSLFEILVSVVSIGKSPGYQSMLVNFPPDISVKDRYICFKCNWLTQRMRCLLLLVQIITDQLIYWGSKIHEII